MQDQDFEKLGLFYLGKAYDPATRETTDELVLYDSKDLTTHAVCVGMTGSGKTGLGLTLLATVTLLDRTMAAEVNESLPSRAPSFFFVDIQPDETEAFDRTIARFKSGADYKRTPMIRGRITAVNGVPSAQVKVDPDVKWALSGDRGITYAATPPPGTVITAGKWWPA